MLKERLKTKRLILGSGSPRRKQLLEGLDLDFEVIVKEIDETWPEGLHGGHIPEHIARMKSEAFGELSTDEILITADTTVWLSERAVNKPFDKEDAKRMIAELSGNSHQVYTGVCIRTEKEEHSFFDSTTVTFKKLDTAEIDYYVEHYNSLDKAGAYGAQDWIGYVGIEKLEGCYFNVMGLPVRRVYASLAGL